MVPRFSIVPLQEEAKSFRTQHVIVKVESPKRYLEASHAFLQDD